MATSELSKVLQPGLQPRPTNHYLDRFPDGWDTPFRTFSENTLLLTWASLKLGHPHDLQLYKSEEEGQQEKSRKVEVKKEHEHIQLHLLAFRFSMERGLRVECKVSFEGRERKKRQEVQCRCLGREL